MLEMACPREWYSNMELFCNNGAHRNHPALAYCLTCSEILCLDCLVECLHPPLGHHTVKLTDAPKELKEILEKEYLSLEDEARRIDNKIIEINREREKIEADVENVIDALQTAIDTLRERLRNFKEMLVSRILAERDYVVRAGRVPLQQQHDKLEGLQAIQKRFHKTIKIGSFEGFHGLSRTWKFDRSGWIPTETKSSSLETTFLIKMDDTRSSSMELANVLNQLSKMIADSSLISSKAYGKYLEPLPLLTSDLKASSQLQTLKKCMGEINQKVEDELRNKLLQEQAKCSEYEKKLSSLQHQLSKLEKGENAMKLQLSKTEALLKETNQKMQRKKQKIKKLRNECEWPIRVQISTDEILSFRMRPWNTMMDIKREIEKAKGLSHAASRGRLGKSKYPGNSGLKDEMILVNSGLERDGLIFWSENVSSFY